MRLGVLNNFLIRSLEGHRMMIYSDDNLLCGCFGVWGVWNFLEPFDILRCNGYLYCGSHNISFLIVLSWRFCILDLPSFL